MGEIELQREKKAGRARDPVPPGSLPKWVQRAELGHPEAGSQEPP